MIRIPTDTDGVAWLQISPAQAEILGKGEAIEVVQPNGDTLVIAPYAKS